MNKKTEPIKEDTQNSPITQLAFLDALDSYVEKKIALRLKEIHLSPCESSITKDINTALAKAQGEFKTVYPNRSGHQHNYADLDTIVMFTRPILTKNGLSVTQEEILTDQGNTVLKTTLRHSSGQWISSCAKIIPAKPGDQGYGASLSYKQRYSYKSLLNITTSNELDVDDYEEQNTANEGWSNNKKQPSSKITKEQLEELEYELNGHDEIAERVLKGLKIQSLADMPKTEFMKATRRIREIKIAEKK